MSPLVIITDSHSPRLRYVCDVIFDDYLNIPYTISSQDDDISDMMVIYYGHKPRDDRESIFIPRGLLIDETGIKKYQWYNAIKEDLPYASTLTTLGHEDEAIPFDLFEFVFYTLSRYEEYHDTQRDKYGRFSSGTSLAAHIKALDIPIVDLWIMRLAEVINTHYKTTHKIKSSKRGHSTIDIDIPYAFKHKGIRNLGGLFKDLISLRGRHLGLRYKYYSEGIDPFDTYSWMISQHHKRALRPSIFFLNRYDRPDDPNHLAFSPIYQTLIQELSADADIGLHPSLHAQSDPTEIRREMTTLADALAHPISLSRQHFLSIKFPHTYIALMACDIHEDYSLLYPDVLGFRAGTAHAYHWYDLSTETTSRLMIHPCQVMDVTLRYYLRYSPEEAIHEIDRIAARCAEVNGTFSFIWHNSNLSDMYEWRPWTEVYEHMLDLIR